MAVMGDLGDFGVVGILHLLAARRGSGRLRLNADGEELNLYLSHGQLTLLTSSLLPPRLGRVLHQRGLISTNQLHEALRLQIAGGHESSLGEIVVSQQWVAPAQVTACVHEQFVGVLARMMTARRGMFAWDPDVEAPVKGLPMALEPDRVLREASHWLAELARLRAELPAPYAPLAPNTQLDVSVAPNNEIEARIITALKGGAVSWRDLTDLLPLDAKTILSALVSMLRRGLLIAAEPSWDSNVDGSAAEAPDEADLARLFGADVLTSVQVR